MKQRRLRIIGGDLRGKKLNPIKGQAIRPTADRIRESIFNILAFRVAGSTVLDLFAGTGALGIEALSRGAAFAGFIDKGDEAVRVIQSNLLACRLLSRALVVQWDIVKNLDCLQQSGLRPDLVLMDPPYRAGMVLPTLGHLERSGVLSPEADIVIEHSMQEPLAGTDSVFKMTDQRTYGKTLVSFLRYMV
jgi:16S rRNA (guanine966-N2)-methyltransferase